MSGPASFEERPDSWRWAVLVWLAYLAVEVLARLLAWFLPEQTAPSAQQQAAEQLDAAGGAIRVLIIVIGLVVVYQLWQGRRWALLLSTIFGVAAVLGGLLSLMGGGVMAAQPPWWIVVPQILLAIGAVVLMYRPESRRFMGLNRGP